MVAAALAAFKELALMPLARPRPPRARSEGRVRRCAASVLASLHRACT